MGSTPQWLKKRLVVSEAFVETKKVLLDLSTNTVCEGARCPNISECFSRKFATFMILGNACTRSCTFCSVSKEEIKSPDTEEPMRIAACARRLGLKYVIVTSVTRDDLYDGGAGQFMKVVEAIRRLEHNAVIELLIPDFAGDKISIEAVALCGAGIIGHNIETIKRLYPAVRKEADYSRSLDVLKFIKEINPKVLTKSAILAGLGETEEEIINTMEDLKEAGCDILTIGQYLSPSKENYPVQRFAPPEEFARLKERGMAMGFKHVSSGPFVRSSYYAEEMYDKCYAAAVS